MGSGFPKRYKAADAPAEVRELVHRLVPSLLEGPHPALAALREQYGRASIESVELSGVGLFVDFAVPSDAPLADPPDFTGGSANITLRGLEQGAGCVLFVRAGKLATFEAYGYGEPWPEDAKVLGVDDVRPINPVPSD